MTIPWTRVRTRGAFKPYPVNITAFSSKFDCSGSTNQTANIADAIRTGVVETMHDFVTTAFEKRRAKGEVFFNPMNHTKQESIIINPGNGEKMTKQTQSCSSPVLFEESWIDGPLLGRRLNAQVLGKPVPLSTRIISEDDINKLKDEVSTKCLAQRGTSDSNLYESIAEYKQTLQLLRNPVGAMGKWLGKNERAITRAKGVGDAWLVYRYGIRPMISDIDGIIKGLKKKVGHQRTTTRSRGQISLSRVDSGTIVTGEPVTLTYSKQSDCTVLVRAMSLDEHVISLYENIGFTSKGLITLPWELVPYSFVADWFVNFGDFLKALVPLPSVHQLGNSLTTEVVETYTYVGISSTRPGWTTNRNISGTFVSRLTTKSREPIRTPSVVIKSDFRFDDATRLADSVALIGQKMGSLFGKR